MFPLTPSACLPPNLGGRHPVPLTAHPHCSSEPGLSIVDPPKPVSSHSYLTKPDWALFGRFVRGRYFVESKAAAGDIIPGKDMNASMTTSIRLLQVICLALGMALAAALPTPLHAQDVKINVGGGNAEEAKTEKELAQKLPPEQAAAYLKSHDAWVTIGNGLGYVALFVMVVAIVAIVQTFRHRRQKLVHETMRLMIEKGLPVPPELINPPPPVKPPKSDLRRGLIWLALGVGLAVPVQRLADEPGIWTVGLVPALIGAAYLLCWAVGLARERREAGPERAGLWPGIFWTLLGVSVILAMFALKHASGEWDELCAWWGVGLIPIGIGLAFLLHTFILWWIPRKKLTQG